MGEPFKNFFSPSLVEKMADTFESVSIKFNKNSFVKKALVNFENLELKERSTQISQALEESLPDSFEECSQILLKSLSVINPSKSSLIKVSEEKAHKKKSATEKSRKAGKTKEENDKDKNKELQPALKGWAILPLTEFVGRKGIENFETSMNLLKAMTPLLTAEFGIRFFILKYPKKTLKILHEWTADKNEHVRRLVSEGSRPLLPWGIKLHQFVEDPKPVILLLEKLKDDPSEYVRRSVANNLNDISKSHPDLVAGLAVEWMKNASPQRKRLVKHACRTLIKNGHPKALKAIGYGPPQLNGVILKILSPKVTLGGYLEFRAKISSDSLKNQPLLVDFVVHHKKANGSHSPKVFKWTTFSLKAEENKEMVKKHPIKKITTRVYYPGTHYLELKINGQCFSKKKFELLM